MGSQRQARSEARGLENRGNARSQGWPCQKKAIFLGHIAKKLQAPENLKSRLKLMVEMLS